MPVTRSAKQEMRLAEKRRVRNKSVRSRAKSSVSRAERLISSGEVAAAQPAVAAATSTLDRAAQKGVVHPNNAARRKSRLMGKLNKAVAQSLAAAEAALQAEPEPETKE